MVAFRWRRWGLALVWAVAAHAGAAAPERTVHLTATEWPPYTSAGMQLQGATTAVLRAAFAAAGYELQVDFFPWRRAVAMAARDPHYLGYFPEYAAATVNREFLLSAPVGDGPLGFAERVDAPVQWQQLDDLAPYRIGVVQGYANTDELDRRVERKLQPADTARDDAQNLLKLVARRVQLAVIDRRVFEYMLRHDPKIMPFAGELRFNGRLLENKRLYVAFRPGPEGERLRQVLNEGLKKIDVTAVMEAALREHF